MTTLRALLLPLILLAPIAARADEAPPPPKEAGAKADQEGFVPVQPNETLSPGESLPGNALVGAAYGFILAAMVVWIASVAVRGRRVEEELEALRARIERGGKQA